METLHILMQDPQLLCWGFIGTPITYFLTVPLILDHSYLVGKLTTSKIADTKVSGF
jgi:hypothetical protein